MEREERHTPAPKGEEEKENDFYFAIIL